MITQMPVEGVKEQLPRTALSLPYYAAVQSVAQETSSSGFCTGSDLSRSALRSKDGRVRANAERQSDHGYGRKARILRHHPQAITNILEEALDVVYASISRHSSLICSTPPSSRKAA